MYKLLTTLRQKLNLTQAAFAELLKTDQAQISRLESGTAGRSFHELCDQLRNYAVRHPEQWLDLLAASQSSDVFSEYRDLFFITENFKIPFQELWVIAAIPLECHRAVIRKQIAQQVQAGAQVTYWVPEQSFDEMHTLARDLENADKVTAHQLTNQIDIISTPLSFTLLPIALIDPQEDKRIGVISPNVVVGEGIRVVVLPHDTTHFLYSHLKNIYSRVRYDGEFNDGTFAWKRQPLYSLIQKAPAQSISKKRQIQTH